MNYIKINDTRYNLADDGINQMDHLKLKIQADEHTFETVKNDFENVNGLEIHGAAEPDDFVSGYFENLTLKSVEYDLKDAIFVVTMSELDETAQRISDLEDAVNFLLMGGEE